MDHHGDMPFLCPIPKCGKRFTNEDHLMVHSKTHEMSLALNTEKSSSSPAHPFVDQTPTPTKILKNFEEIGLGLFQELSKNPFDDAYKKALDSEVAPLPGPQSNELNTPTLIMTDSTRHISTSTAGGVTSLFPMAIDRLKSSAESKLRPSPLAAQESGKKRSGGGGDAMASLSSSGLNLSNKNASLSSVMTVTRSKHRELTSQVADSTSTDVPLDMPNNSGDLEDDEDSAFLVATQSITSPHSTTAIISTTSNLGKQPPLSSLSSSSSFSLSTMDKNLKGSDTNKTSSSSSTTTVTVAPAPRVKTELVAEEMTSPQQQQCTMQVLLQLPNGQTVPISIPATINNPLIVDDKQAQQQQLQQQLQQQQQQQDIKPQVTTLVIPQQQQQPLLQPAPSKSRPTAMSTTSTTTMTLKQRLKAQLQNQVSPTAKSSSSSSSSLSDHQSNSNNNIHHHHHISNTTTTTAAATSAFVPVSLAAVTSAAGAGSVVQMIPSSNHATVVTAPAPAQSPQQQLTQMYFTQASSTSPIMMMLDSPGSEVNMSDSSEYSFDSKRQKLSPDCEDPEERRRKFLERNRAAAARCRQKRKHWIGNLERKADDLQNTNLRLQNDVKLLRGEVAHLKTLLLAHKDCPVTQQQRSSGQLHQVILTDNPTAFSNQELAQVVPTGGDTLTSEPIQIGQSATIMTFLSDRSGGGARGATGLSENGKDD